MSLPRSKWPAWTDRLLVGDERSPRYGQPRWWVRVAWPFIRFCWWDRGWGFGHTPWYTSDDLAFARERARALGMRLGLDWALE